MKASKEVWELRDREQEREGITISKDQVCVRMSERNLLLSHAHWHILFISALRGKNEFKVSMVNLESSNLVRAML